MEISHVLLYRVAYLFVNINLFAMDRVKLSNLHIAVRKLLCSQSEIKYCLSQASIVASVSLRC